MNNSLKYIGISVDESSFEDYKHYHLNAKQHVKLERFLRAEFSDIIKLKITSTPSKTEFSFVSTQTSISDFWTAVHLYLKIPYRKSVKFPEFRNEVFS